MLKSFTGFIKSSYILSKQFSSFGIRIGSIIRLAYVNSIGLSLGVVRILTYHNIFSLKEYLAITEIGLYSFNYFFAVIMSK